MVFAGSPNDPSALEALEPRLLLSSTIEITAKSKPVVLYDFLTSSNVVVRLTGPGTASITTYTAGLGPIDLIQLIGTSKSSTLSIDAQAPKGSPKGFVPTSTLGGLTILPDAKGNASLGSLKAGEITLTANGDPMSANTGVIDAAGYISTITLAGVQSGSQILMHTNPGLVLKSASTTLTLGSVTDATINTSDVTIAKLTVSQWADSSDATTDIVAPQIKYLKSGGVFAADVNLQNVRTSYAAYSIQLQEMTNSQWTVSSPLLAPTAVSSLNSVYSFKVLGTVTGSTLQVDGNITKVSAGAALNSHFNAGIERGVWRPTPLNLNQFKRNSKLGTFTITGLKLPRGVAQPTLFDNTTIAAPTVGTVSLRNANAGGVYAYQQTAAHGEIKKISVKNLANNQTKTFSFKSKLVGKVRVGQPQWVTGRTVTQGYRDAGLPDFYVEETPEVFVNSFGAENLASPTTHFAAGNFDTFDSALTPADPTHYYPTGNGTGNNSLTPLYAYEGRTVMLNADATSPMGPVSYSWEQISGKTVTLANADTANATFVVPTLDASGIDYETQTVITHGTDTLESTKALFRVTITDGISVTTKDVYVTFTLLSDVDHDGRLTYAPPTSDRVYITHATNKSDLERYDLNGDGTVNSTDADVVYERIYQQEEMDSQPKYYYDTIFLE